MGADILEGIISASTLEEAIQKYRRLGLSGWYDGFTIVKPEVKFYTEEFETVENALKFLNTKSYKWDDFAVMVKLSNKLESAFRILREREEEDLGRLSCLLPEIIDKICCLGLEKIENIYVYQVIFPC